MKSIFSSFLLALCVTATSSAQIITNFGFNAFTDDGWNWNQETSVLSGTELGGYLLYGEPLNITISDSADISITAHAITAPNAGFNFVLEDNSGRTATALFNWLDFTGGTQTITANVVADIDFDFSNISYWNLVSGGSGQAINVTLFSAAASAVPEPAAYTIIFSLIATGLFYARRRPRA